MKIKLVIPAIVALLICNVSFAAHHEMAENPNEAVAVNWLKAQATGKAETIAYVSEHFAEDGMVYGDRYVGFGFTFNPDDDSKMVIERIIPGSPASKVLRSGDEFIVVKGVRVNKRTMDKLSFRGKPGEPVDGQYLRAQNHTFGQQHKANYHHKLYKLLCSPLALPYYPVLPE